jgi:hypothetical protein
MTMLRQLGLCILHTYMMASDEQLGCVCSKKTGRYRTVFIEQLSVYIAVRPFHWKPR